VDMSGFRRSARTKEAKPPKEKKVPCSGGGRWRGGEYHWFIPQESEKKGNSEKLGGGKFEKNLGAWGQSSEKKGMRREETNTQNARSAKNALHQV